MHLFKEDSVNFLVFENAELPSDIIPTIQWSQRKLQLFITPTNSITIFVQVPTYATEQSVNKLVLTLWKYTEESHQFQTKIEKAHIWKDLVEHNIYIHQFNLRN